MRPELIFHLLQIADSMKHGLVGDLRGFCGDPRIDVHDIVTAGVAFRPPNTDEDDDDREGWVVSGTFVCTHPAAESIGLGTVEVKYRIQLEADTYSAAVDELVNRYALPEHTPESYRFHWRIEGDRSVPITEFIALQDAIIQALGEDSQRCFLHGSIEDGWTITINPPAEEE